MKINQMQPKISWKVEPIYLVVHFKNISIVWNHGWWIILDQCRFQVKLCEYFLKLQTQVPWKCFPWWKTTRVYVNENARFHSIRKGCIL